MSKYYMEYQILKDRPGLLGDVASLIGMLKLNIQTISSIENHRRGFLLDYNSREQLTSLYTALEEVNDLELKIFDQPTQLDLLALKHGKRIKQVNDNPPTYFFKRKELDQLIDFLSEKLEEDNNLLIGFRGSPRIGKTETAIAASVHANKQWAIISSTLFRKIARTNINPDLLENGTILLIDAITTFYRSFPEHIKFAKNIISKPIPRIIEHPDVLVKETDMELDRFDLIIELSSSENDEQGEEENKIKKRGFYSFDIS